MAFSHSSEAIRLVNRVTYILLQPLLFFLMLLVQSDSFGQESTDRTGESATADSVASIRLQAIRKALDEATEYIEARPTSLDGYSRRGDAQLFLGHFPEAVADYEKLTELEPRLAESHWRRGIALFYAGKFEGASAQFESCHSLDQIDRENGIWRYLSQYRVLGKNKAQERLIEYTKSDREPFPSVYKLFAGKVMPDEILHEIAVAEISRIERESRLFYAHLYIGLNFAIDGDDIAAQKHLTIATANRWAPSGGYGPNYMWQVGQMHNELLRSKKTR